MSDQYTTKMGIVQVIKTSPMAAIPYPNTIPFVKMKSTRSRHCEVGPIVVIDKDEE